MHDNSSFELTIISNLPVEPFLAPHVNRIFEQNGIIIRTVAVNYDECNSSEALQRFAESEFIAILLNLENAHHGLLDGDSTTNASTIIDLELEKARQIWKIIGNGANAPSIWFGYEDLQWNPSVVFGSQYALNGLVDKINSQIREGLDSGITFIDTKRLIASIGISNAYSHKNKFRWNYPYSQLLSERIGLEIYKQYLITHGKTKKCIVLDCDNVLWGGIISEDGFENIKLGSSGLGKPFQDFQRFLLMLHDHGVILTICSKNDESDVLRVFREHSDMVLREDHIACFRVNWDAKAENIRDIAAALNISLDSMVFIDDSDFEIEAIRTLLPDVTPILYRRDCIYEALSCFNLRRDIDIIGVKQRYDAYKTDEYRRELKKHCQTFDEYLVSLDMKVDIHEATPIEYARISELTQRTNQMTNGIRYTVKELKTHVTNPEFKLYSVSVSDRFSNLGIVGAMAVENDELQLFSLSCRALGRNIETTMLDVVKCRHEITRYRFCNTSKNGKIRSILKEFKVSGDRLGNSIMKASTLSISSVAFK